MAGDTYTHNRFKWLEAITADSRLHSTAVRVAVVIGSHLNRQSGEAFPSIKTIATKSATPERSVERAVADLCKAGYLERRRGGFSQPNRYAIPETSPHRGNLDQSPNPVTRGGNEAGSPATGGGNEKAIPATDGGSVPPLVADHSRHGWRTNPLIEPFEIELREETHVNAGPVTGARVPDKWKTTPRPSEIDLPDGFAEFWLQYPRKIGKGAAQRAYRSALKTAQAAAIMAGCLRFAAAKASAYEIGEDPRFTPHPATWLNGRRWEDEPEPKAVTPLKPATMRTDRKQAVASTVATLRNFAEARRELEADSLTHGQAQCMRLAQ